MSLTNEQLKFIDDLFELGGDETAVLQKHAISRTVYQDWLKEKEFTDCICERLKSSKLHSEILLSKYVSFAATKLIQLCQSENQETSRKACLDILNLQTLPLANARGSEELNEQLDPALASKILAVLAENQLEKEC